MASLRFVLLLCACLLAGCRSTAPFLDAQGRQVPDSIATMEMLDIHGTPQSVWFRGQSTRKPILVLLHGGPGASESALFRHFNAALEREFVVVYWEQRGTGRSWNTRLPRETLTLRQLTEDLDVLVDHVRRRFGQQKVILLGHSWGTVLGVTYAARHPQKIAAYLGVAQVVNTVAAQRREQEFNLARAAQSGNGKAQAAIVALGDPPYDVDRALALEGWTERFGGLFAGGLAKRDLISAALATDEAGVMDLVLFGIGNRFSLGALWPEHLGVRFDVTHRRLEVPVVLALGRHDQHVSSQLAAQWFDALDAPAKQLVWFERSAHNPPFEQPSEFNELVIRALATR